MKKLFYPLIFVTFVLVFFWQFIFKGLLPIPADTIVGLYHPWRDFYVKDFPNGIPFKNFLITDPVRQQYVWKHLSIDLIKHGQLPFWNPYNFSGTPFLANFQSAPFYPLNILFFVLPFNFAWSILVLLQPLLGGIFLYFYLQSLKINKWASLLGALTFSFSGFTIAWLEWNTILHAGLWLPLILLAVDKIFHYLDSLKNSKPKPKTENLLFWSGVFIFSLISSFFAGHLQIFFYVSILAVFYIVIRLIQLKLAQSSILPSIILFTILGGIVILITCIQWLPTLHFISISGREFDLPNWQNSSWFIPWQHLVQFLVPDFFGNPATLNYWGEWNYGEFVGYIGVLPLIFALLAIFCRRDKKTWFFVSMTIISLVFALPTVLAKLPYQWQLPLISTSQPTRLLFITDFSLSILAALGFDFFIKSNNFKNFMKVILLFGVVFFSLWLFVLFSQALFKSVTVENLATAKRNLILPTAVFLFFTSLVIVYHILIYHIRGRRFYWITEKLFIMAILILVVFDLFRFGWKFTPFTKEEWLFTETKTIRFLKDQPKPFRFMTTDRRIFPPNFSTFYKIEDLSGYDPIYLKSYAELVAAWNRGKPDISPFSFNRILTPQDYSSKIADLLNVKYVLSLKEEVSPKLKLVFQEGQTRIYENKEVQPRAFFVEEIKIVKDKQEAINAIFAPDFEPRKVAIIYNTEGVKGITPLRCEGCRVKIMEYRENRIIMETENETDGFLVLADNFYPSWQARIDGTETKIYLTDYNLRGVVIPKGDHQLEFKIKFFPL